MKNSTAQCTFRANLIAVLNDKFITELWHSAIKDCLCEEKREGDLYELMKMALKKEARVNAITQM